MRSLYIRILKTVAFSSAWIAFILAGLGYLFPGTWGGTLWGEIIMLLIAIVITLTIYWGLTTIEKR